MINESDLFESLNYVSRGGQKLAKALDSFKVSPKDKVCIDCGASTGGFTDCLLQRGARLVYAIDVGYGQLAWTLRNDPRVKVMERTNIRYVTPDMLKNPDKSKDPGSSADIPTLAVIDVSFISLSLVLPVIHNLLIDPYEAICLIKPQFEAGKGKVGKKGVVNDPEIHKEVLRAFEKYAADSGFRVIDITHSPVKGPKGNIEYLGYLISVEDGVSCSSNVGANCVRPPDIPPLLDIEAIVAQSHKELNL